MVFNKNNKRDILRSFRDEVEKSAGFFNAKKIPFKKRLVDTGKNLLTTAGIIAIPSAALLGYGAIKYPDINTGGR